MTLSLWKKKDFFSKFLYSPVPEDSWTNVHLTAIK